MPAGIFIIRLYILKLSFALRYLWSYYSLNSITLIHLLSERCCIIFVLNKERDESAMLFLALSRFYFHRQAGGDGKLEFFIRRVCIYILIISIFIQLHLRRIKSFRAQAFFYYTYILNFVLCSYQVSRSVKVIKKSFIFLYQGRTLVTLQLITIDRPRMFLFFQIQSREKKVIGKRHHLMKP